MLGFFVDSRFLKLLTITLSLKRALLNNSVVFSWFKCLFYLQFAEDEGATSVARTLSKEDYPY